MKYDHTYLPFCHPVLYYAPSQIHIFFSDDPLSPIGATHMYIGVGPLIIMWETYQKDE